MASCSGSVSLSFCFSSRRRHTRFDCDWSSDVCSSDLKHSSRLEEGPTVNADLVREIADDEMSKLRERLGDEAWKKSRFTEARKAFEQVALAPEFEPFLTLVALKYID